MAYYRNRRLPDLGVRIDMTDSKTEDQILLDSKSNLVVLVAHVPKGSFEGVKRRDPNWEKIFFANLIAFEKPMALERPLWPDVQYLEQSKNPADRVVCLVYPDSTIKPVNLVKSRYTTLQNRFVIRDALNFLQNSGGSAKLVSAGSFDLDRIFSIQFTFKVIEVEIENKVHEFKQDAVLFTSHDSSQAYGMAFGRVGKTDLLYSSWQTMKMRHTSKIHHHADQVKQFLEGCESAGDSFIAQVSTLGKISIDPNSKFYKETLEDLLARNDKGMTYNYDRRGWEIRKITQYFNESAKTYGHNAWALYMALGTFTFNHIHKLTSEQLFTDLKESYFELQNALKAQLIPTLSFSKLRLN